MARRGTIDTFNLGFVFGVFGYIIFWMWLLGPRLHDEMVGVGRSAGPGS